MAVESVPVGGNKRRRVLREAGADTDVVRDETEIAGEALEIQRALLTEVRAIRHGLELALGIELDGDA